MQIFQPIKIVYFVFVCIASSLLFSSFNIVSSGVPPSGYSGATGANCSTCHAPPIVPSTGFVSTPSLPSAYIPGDSYPFSVLISNAAGARWGFSMKAIDASGNPIGTFSTTNSNAGVTSDELHHVSAVSSPAPSYTYNNLTWTAPATPMGPVTFYVAAVAADGMGGNGNDNVHTNTSTATALPIELISFKGKNEQKANFLTWQTASESNNSHFEIERSEDGVMYESIGKINGQRNSSTVQSYSFSDKNIWNKTNYYRLKQVDFDGRSTTSKAIVLKNQTNADFKVFPNPTKDFVQVSLSNDEIITKIELIDLQGRTVLETDKNQLSLKNQTKGTYVVRATNGEGQFFSKMIVVE
jgi:hypothetical protein